MTDTRREGEGRGFSPSKSKDCTFWFMPTCKHALQCVWGPCRCMHKALKPAHYQQGTHRGAGGRGGPGTLGQVGDSQLDGFVPHDDVAGQREGLHVHDGDAASSGANIQPPTLEGQMAKRHPAGGKTQKAMRKKAHRYQEVCERIPHTCTSRKARRVGRHPPRPSPRG